MFPNGVEDDVMLAVAPEVVGLSKTVSESTSASGVDGLEAMAREWEKSRPEMGGVLGRGRGEGEWRR